MLYCVMLCCEECPATDVHSVLVAYHATKHNSAVIGIIIEYLSNCLLTKVLRVLCVIFYNFS